MRLRKFATAEVQKKKSWNKRYFLRLSLFNLPTYLATAIEEPTHQVQPEMNEDTDSLSSNYVSQQSDEVRQASGGLHSGKPA